MSPKAKKHPTPDEALVEVRRICTAFPEVTERMSHGAPTWFVKDKTVLLAFRNSGHHDNAFPHLLLPAPPGVQEELTNSEPDRFFRPPYVGHRGWVGMRMDGDVDWDEIEAMAEEAYRLVAPKSLVKRLQEP